MRDLKALQVLDTQSVRGCPPWKSEAVNFVASSWPRICPTRVYEFPISWTNPESQSFFWDAAIFLEILGSRPPLYPTTNG